DNEFHKNNEFFKNNEFSENYEFPEDYEFTEDKEFSGNNEFPKNDKLGNELPEDDPSFYHKASNLSINFSSRAVFAVRSSDDDSKDLEYDIFEPLSHLDTVITTNPADGSSQNFLIIRSMCHIIYNSLFDYWDKLMNGLLASLLDSQLKTLLTGMKKLVKELKKN
ncbi:11942_t:CDS:2, partial [Gigaspora rosea]